jgi:hypothetical protein
MSVWPAMTWPPSTPRPVGRRYHHSPRVALPRIRSNRGFAVAYGRVFEATDDARVIALDQATGKIVWDKVVQPFDPSALVPSGNSKPDIGFLMLPNAGRPAGL